MFDLSPLARHASLVRAAARRRAVVAIVAGVGCMFAMGCPESSPPRPPPELDAGPDLPDANPYFDSDEDGLCDLTEESRMTDPLSPDTDGDGFTDYWEVFLNFDPIQPSSPDRATVHTLRENADSSVQAISTVVVRGEGEDYTGAFEWIRRVLGVTAGAFYDSSEALFANPTDNAALVDPEAELFGGVVGTTELHFETRLSFRDNIERRCIRAYPFRYVVKRSDGRVVGFDNKLLLVLPVGVTLASGEWCTPDPPCM